MDRRSFLKSAVSVPVGSAMVSGVTEGPATQNDEPASASSESHTGETTCDACTEYDKLQECVKMMQPRKGSMRSQFFMDQFERVGDPENHTLTGDCKFKNNKRLIEESDSHDVSVTTQGHSISITVSFDHTSIRMLSMIDTEVTVNE